ncbi:ABC transporter substrate-binding protein [Niallia sp. 03133]|uniref:ABC transporter substrate-binding protein n=1 Tax=Niallia sp. 03133 TaxID=3458060 RepID=UPI004044C9F9
MKRQYKKLLSLAGVGVLSLGLLAGCAPPKGTSDSAGNDAKKDNKEEIKVGLVTQLSGGGALYGEQMKNGAQLAVDEINEAGGVSGKKLKLVVQDDQANPSESVKVTQRLVTEQNIDAWMGTLKSSDTLTDLTITSKQDIPSFVPIAVADAITQSGYKNVFRNVSNNSLQVKALVDYILKNQPHKKIAIIAENTDYGRGLTEAFTKDFKAGGGKVINNEFYNVGQKEFNDQLTKIKSNKPDAIVISGLVAEGSLIVKQAKDLGMDTQFYSYGGFMGTAPIDLAGKAADGLIHTEYFTPVKGDKKIESFVNNYEKKYNKVPDSYYSAATYDAIYLYAEGVKNAGSVEGAKVNEAIRGIKNFQGVMGNISFDSEGQANTKVWIGQIQDGKQVVIHRPE